MKNNGFTLVELLAVIVILAIIALIAVPIVLNIINSSKEESNKRSAELYINAVENAIVKKNMDGEFNPINCTVNVEGNVACEGTILEVEVDGTRPKEGSTITIDNGIIASYSLTINGKQYTKTSNSNNPPIIQKKYENGEAVYFNVTTGEKCNSQDTVSTTGTKSGCMKFYAFNDTLESTTVNLILDHNTTALVAWNSSGSNKLGPNEVLTQLASDTSSWHSSIMSPTTYTLDQTGQSSNANYTINYANYGNRARLITANEIAQIVGNTGWDETTATSWYYLDSKTQTQTATSKGKSNYAWLFDYTYECTSYGCNIADSSTYGYWTSSACADDNTYAWNVRYSGYVHSFSASIYFYYGVRPVITISKSLLN